MSLLWQMNIIENHDLPMFSDLQQLKTWMASKSYKSALKAIVKYLLYLHALIHLDKSWIRSFLCVFLSLPIMFEMHILRHFMIKAGFCFFLIPWVDFLETGQFMDSTPRANCLCWGIRQWTRRIKDDPGGQH